MAASGIARSKPGSAAWKSGMPSVGPSARRLKRSAARAISPRSRGGRASVLSIDQMLIVPSERIAALAAMRSDGTINIWSMLSTLARPPRDLGLMARAALRFSRRALGPTLGIPDFHAADPGFDRAMPLAAMEPAE